MTATAVTVHHVRPPDPTKGDGLLGIVTVTVGGVFMAGARLVQLPKGPRLLAPRLARKSDRIEFDAETWDAATAAAVEAMEATGSRIDAAAVEAADGAQKVLGRREPEAGNSDHVHSLNADRRKG